MSELSGFHRNRVANPIPQKVLETAKNLDKGQALQQQFASHFHTSNVINVQTWRLVAQSANSIESLLNMLK